MRVPAVSLGGDVMYLWEVRLYQDTNGNWFGRVEQRDGVHIISTCYTGTYTDPREALDEAYSRKPPQGVT